MVALLGSEFCNPAVVFWCCWGVFLVLELDSAYAIRVGGLEDL